MFKKKEKKPKLEEYNFKFINREIPVSYESDISYEFNELKECLASENVNLSFDDILKSFDMWLRLIGLGRSTNDESEIEQILSMCGPVTTFNVFDDNKSTPEQNQAYVKGFISIFNLVAEDDLNSNITNIETVMSGLDILFKEYSIFWNDITKLMYNVFTKEHPNEYSLIVESEKDISKFIKLSITNDSLYGTSIVIYSTMVGHKPPKNVFVIKGTYKDKSSK